MKYIEIVLISKVYNYLILDLVSLSEIKPSEQNFDQLASKFINFHLLSNMKKGKHKMESDKNIMSLSALQTEPIYTRTSFNNFQSSKLTRNPNSFVNKNNSSIK
jgi:hypothetical protein